MSINVNKSKARIDVTIRFDPKEHKAHIIHESICSTVPQKSTSVKSTTTEQCVDSPQ